MTEWLQKNLISKPSRWFYLIAFAFITYAFYHFANIRKVAKLFESIDPLWLIAALIFQALTYFFAGRTYKFLMEKLCKGVNLAGSELYKLALLTVFVNHVAPSGTISGNAFLFRELVRRDAPGGEALSVIIMEALTYYIAAIGGIILLTFIFLLTWKGSIPPLVLLVIIVGIIFYVGLFILIFLFGKRNVIAGIIRRLSRFKFFKKKLESIGAEADELKILKEVENPIHALITHKMVYVRVIVSQAMIMALDAFTIVCLLNGFGVHIRLIYILFGFILTFIIAALPLSPGSLIVFEGSMAYFYTLLGVPLAAALVVTLLFRALSFWLPMGVGVFLTKSLFKDKVQKV